jgi:putative DNA primase/helicase
MSADLFELIAPASDPRLGLLVQLEGNPCTCGEKTTVIGRGTETHTFTASHSDRHPAALAMLKGARMVEASETEEGRAWAEARIKQMTGGDLISARFMRQDFFKFMPQFKLLLIGNHKPTLRNVDDAARRRFHIVPLVYKPPIVDKDLEEKKLKPEWPGIFRWMIDGCLEWQRSGLMPPPIVIDTTQEYFAEHGPHSAVDRREVRDRADLV